MEERSNEFFVGFENWRLLVEWRCESAWRGKLCWKRLNWNVRWFWKSLVQSEVGVIRSLSEFENLQFGVWLAECFGAVWQIMLEMLVRAFVVYLSAFGAQSRTQAQGQAKFWLELENGIFGG